MEHRLYYWKISCIIGRLIVVLEDRLYYWKSTVLLEDLLRCWKMNGRSKVLLENQLYWRQSTGLDGNYRSRKITARRWLHKYVGAECGASSFTWYLYQMCNTDVSPSVCPACRIRPITSTVLDGFFPYLPQMITTMRWCVAHNDLWPWPISSRSLGLDLENRVRSVASTVQDGLFFIFGTNNHYH